MSKMKIIDEIADAQVSYIKETLYDSIQWGIDGTELDVKGLEGDAYNDLMTMIYNATIEKLKLEMDEKQEI